MTDVQDAEGRVSPLLVPDGAGDPGWTEGEREVALARAMAKRRHPSARVRPAAWEADRSRW